MKYSLPDTRYKFSNSYAAIKESNNRQAIVKNLSSVDADLKPRDREKAISRVRTHQKDFSIAVWAVNKHLDFVAEHTLTVNTEDAVLNQDIEAAVEEASEHSRFDAAGIHSLQTFTRLIESHAVIDGDIFVQKLRDGRVQGIESDRVFNPSRAGDSWSHGVELDKLGAIKRVAVHSRGNTRNSFSFERYASYSNLFHHGYFQRLDQKRGVSLMLPGVNDFQDVYENKAYGLARMKVAQMFGVVMKSAAVSEGGVSPDLSQGQFYTEISNDDSMEFLQDKTPATEWQNFMDSVIGMGLKALDIPFSFYREDFTNFFGARSALILYLKSCLAKRRNLCQRFLNPWLEWKINELRSKPEFSYLRKVEKVPFKWIPFGTPSANPVQEAQALALRIALGVDSRTRGAQEISGTSFSDHVQQISQEQDFMREFNIEPMQTKAMVQQEVNDDE